MPSSRRQYPRTARLNQWLREVIAEELEAMGDTDDERLDLVTVTGVEATSDLQQARVYFSARHEGAAEALEEQRVRLQAAIGRQARFKRTPHLAFVEDPGVASGWRIEGILQGLKEHGDEGGS